MGQAGAEVTACSTPNGPPPPGSQPASPACHLSFCQAEYLPHTGLHEQAKSRGNYLRAMESQEPGTHVLVFSSPSWTNIL